MFVRQIASLQRFRTWVCAEHYFYAKLLASAVAGVFAITVFAIAFLYVNVRDYQRTTERDQLLDALRETNKAETALSDLETSFRSYLATGQVAYRQAFTGTAEQLQARLDDLVRTSAPETVEITQLAQKQLRDWLKKVARTELGQPVPKLITAEATIPATISTALRQLSENRQSALERAMRSEGLDDIYGQTLLYTPRLEAAISQLRAAKWDYLTSGDSAALKSYREAAASFDTYYSHLLVLLKEHDEPSAQLQKIRQQLEAWVRESADPEIAAKTKGGNLLVLM